MKQPLYVMVPCLDDTAPIKWAVALCNGLVQDFLITLICLKGIVSREGLKPEVAVIPLNPRQSFRSKYKAIKTLLDSESGKLIVISIGFSADLMNFFLRSRARIVASLRGNLSTAYPNQYGLAGYLLAWLHYRILKRFNRVIVLSETMKKQVQRLNLKRLLVVGNFLDEILLESFREKYSAGSNGNEKVIIFVGRLFRGKRPDLLIKAARSLRDQGMKLRLLILGDGVMRHELEQLVRGSSLEDNITFLGHVQNPFSLIQKADFMVLPSGSEGIPRVVLESLFFGVPCIVRDVDSNAELIKHGVNGYLFASDQELVRVLSDALLKDSLKSNRCLIPPEFRYQENIEKISNIIKNELTY